MGNNEAVEEIGLHRVPCPFDHCCGAANATRARALAGRIYLEFSRQVHRSAQEAQIIFPRNFDTAKLLQVWREPLRVKQGEFSLALMVDQRHQRDFRRIRYIVKHGFAKKSATDRYAVESTSEPALLPGFDGMRAA